MFWNDLFIKQEAQEIEVRSQGECSFSALLVVNWLVSALFCKQIVPQGKANPFVNREGTFAILLYLNYLVDTKGRF